MKNNTPTAPKADEAKTEQKPQNKPLTAAQKQARCFGYERKPK